MKYKVSFFLIIFMISFPLVVFPQTERKTRPDKEEEVRRHIQTFRMWEMTKALDLTEEQASKIFPVLNKLEKEKAELNRRIWEEIRGLRELLKEEKPDSSLIKEKLDRIKGLKKQIQEMDNKIEKLLEDNLTIEQQAKYVLFSIRFMKDLKEKINRARQLYRQRMMQREKKDKYYP